MRWSQLGRMYSLCAVFYQTSVVCNDDNDAGICMFVVTLCIHLPSIIPRFCIGSGDTSCQQGDGKVGGQPV